MAKKKQNPEYHKKWEMKNKQRRKEYFREYARKNRERNRAKRLFGDLAKSMKTHAQITKKIQDNSEQLKRERIKLEIKIEQIKKFLNLK